MRLLKVRFAAAAGEVAAAAQQTALLTAREPWNRTCVPNKRGRSARPYDAGVPAATARAAPTIASSRTAVAAAPGTHSHPDTGTAQGHTPPLSRLHGAECACAPSRADACPSDVAPMATADVSHETELAPSLDAAAPPPGERRPTMREQGSALHTVPPGYGLRAKG